KSAGTSPALSWLDGQPSLVAAVDVNVADVAAIVDVALERQVGGLVIAIAQRPVSTDAIGAVAVVSVAPATREPTHPQVTTVRRNLSDRQYSASRVGTKDRTEDPADRGPVIQPALDRGGASLRRHRRIHAISAVAVVPIAMVAIGLLSIAVRILGGGRSRSRDRREAHASSEHLGHQFHGSSPFRMKWSLLTVTTRGLRRVSRRSSPQALGSSR